MKITLYTINDCKFSQEEREYLKTNNLTFEEKNLETNRDFLTEMLAVSNNFAGTPVTKVEKDNGEVVVLKGFTKDEFDAIFGSTPQPVISAQAPVVQDTQVAGTSSAPPTSPQQATTPPSPLPETGVQASAEPAQQAPIVVESLSGDSSLTSAPSPTSPMTPDPLSPQPSPVTMPVQPVSPTPQVPSTIPTMTVTPTSSPTTPQPIPGPTTPQSPPAPAPGQDPLNSVLQNLQSQVQGAPADQQKQ